MSEPSQTPQPWWHSFFDDTYARVGLEADPQETGRIADFLVRPFPDRGSHRATDHAGLLWSVESTPARAGWLAPWAGLE